MERTCLDCDAALKGRSDKKFCDDQCRSNYNNRLKSDHSGAVKMIDPILKKNRKILAKLNPEGKARMNRSKLTAQGFNFTYFTHVYETQKGKTYKFCYEYGYLELEGNELLLVRKEEKA